MSSMRTITDEMARLLQRCPINGCAKLAWEVSTALAEYARACREEEEKNARLADKCDAAVAVLGRAKQNIDRVLGRKA